MHTKFHWCLHMAGQLQKHRVLPSCYVQERKHKVVKRHLVLRSAKNVVCCLLVFGELYMFGLLNSLRVGNVLSLTVSGNASSISNTTSFEKSVLSEVLCHDLSKTADESIFSETARLEHKRKAIQEHPAGCFQVSAPTEFFFYLQLFQGIHGACWPLFKK